MNAVKYFFLENNWNVVLPATNPTQTMQISKKKTPVEITSLS
jgi:hypothetical protein